MFIISKLKLSMKMLSIVSSNQQFLMFNTPFPTISKLKLN